MKYIITDRQYRVLTEQVKGVNSTTLTPSEPSSVLQPTTNVQSGTYQSTLGKSIGDIHTELALLQIGTAFIPYVGLYISAGIGLVDAGIYYKEGDKTMAAVTAVLSAVPFVSKIPGVKETGKKVMSAIISKIISGVRLTNTELQAVKVIGANKDLIIKELATGATKLEPIAGSVKSFKPTFISKFGQQKYDDLLKQFLSNKLTKQEFVNSLKSAGGETYKLADISVKGGIKFLQSELKSMTEIVPYIKNGTTGNYFIKLNVNGTIKNVEVVVADIPSKSWKGLAVPSKNKIFMNLGELKGATEQEIRQTLYHESTHIKDPSLISPKLNQSYEKIKKAKNVAGEKFDDLYTKAKETGKGSDEAIKSGKEYENLYQRYLYHPQEVIANNQMILNNMTSELDNVVQELGPDGTKKVLDNLIGYTSGKNQLSKESLELLGKNGEEHLNGLYKYNKKYYQNFLKKLAKQSEYLKTQLNLLN